MQQLMSNQLHFVSGGSPQCDIVDIASITLGIHLFSSLAIHTFRIAGVAWHQNIYTLIPMTMAEIAGAYLGYRVGQYFKGDEKALSEAIYRLKSQ